jgi:ribosomal subunit interface protein
MNISFKTHNLELDPEIRIYAEEKASAVRKVLAHFDDADISCEVVLARDDKHASGLVYRADITAYAGAEKVHAVGHGESLKAAIDIAKDDVVRRATHEKDKRITLVRRGRAKVKEWLRFGRGE